jgi:4-amino-4-deoxy-L-arabinose transferase-like glycosyltransferase
VFHLLNHYQIRILFLTLLGLLLRLFQLGEWSFWHDEALTVLLAQKPMAQLIAITAADVHPPLYFLLVKGFLLVGQNEFIVRLLSALCGAGTVFVLYLLGRDLFEEQVGLVGALIMAISPLQLFYAQEARMYTLLLLLIIFSSWCFVRALRYDRRLWWVLFVVGITLASYTAYFTFPVVAAMGLYVLLVDKRRERVLHFLFALGVVVLLYLPWLSVFLVQTRAILDSYWIARPHPLTLFTTLSAFFIGVTLSPFWIAVSLSVTLLLIFIVFSNVYHALKKGVDVQPLIWLLLWGFVPLLGIFLISLVRPLFQLRTVITAAPAFYLLVAWGVARVQYKRLNLLLFFPTLAVMFLSMFNFYFDPVFAKPAWRQAAHYVHEHTQPGDIVLHTSDGSFLPFLVYEHDVQHTLLPVDPELARQNAPSQSIVAAVGETSQPIDQTVQGYRRAWLVVGLDQAVDHQRKQKKEFDLQYRLLEETRIGGIYIFTYALD